MYTSTPNSGQDPPSPKPDEPAEGTSYLLSEVQNRPPDELYVIGSSKRAVWTACQRIAELAPTLKEAELRILLELTAAAEQSSQHTVKISSRDLAKSTKLARSAIVRAIDRLTSRGLITTTNGSTTTASGFLVNILNTVKLGGPLKGPGWSSKGTTQLPIEYGGGPPTGPEVVLLEDQGGPFRGPPTVENSGLSQDRPSVDIDTISINIIDQLLRAKPSDFSSELIATARRWMHGYIVKLGTDPHAHPPDNRIVAQFLSIAEWPALERVLQDLMAERKPAGYSHAWFVSVALQRIHGIDPRALRQRRSELQVVRHKPAKPKEQPFQETLLQATMDRVKGMP